MRRFLRLLFLRLSGRSHRWRWAFFGLLSVLALSLSVACSGAFLPNSSANQSSPSEATAPQPSPAPAEPPLEPTAAPLPPETAALVASAGPNGLYDPPRKDLRLVVISDLNSAYGSTTYDPEVDQGIQLLPFWRPDMVIGGGDMIAGQSPSLSASQINAMWAAFDRHVAGPLRNFGISFGFTIGNHDASGARNSANQFVFQQERDLAAAYWQAPEHDPGLQFVDRYEFPFFYSFSLGDVFFVSWDGSTNTLPADKLAWVEQTLASEAAQQAKMRVIISHLPLYGIAVGRDKPGEVLSNAEELRQLLERYRVHTYISGHQHAYYPGHRGNLQLLHSGILGSGPRALIAGDASPYKSITVVDIDFDSPELTTYTTYNMQTLALVETASLPRSLTGHNGLVLRRDVAWEELGTAEQNACIQKLSQALCGGLQGVAEDALEKRPGAA
ncbi:MAG TPA: metallophosphoesterase [Trichocoleus sp.]